MEATEGPAPAAPFAQARDPGGQSPPPVLAFSSPGSPLASALPLQLPWPAVCILFCPVLLSRGCGHHEQTPATSLA